MDSAFDLSFLYDPFLPLSELDKRPDELQETLASDGHTGTPDCLPTSVSRVSYSVVHTTITSNQL